MKDNHHLADSVVDTGSAQQSKNHIGAVVDGFWKRIPRNHRAFKINPLTMPSPHEHLLSLGNEVIKLCHSQGYTFEEKLIKQVDVEAWTRLLGAWVCFCRTRIEATGDLPPRSTLAAEMDVDPSSLTNFLNARRPVTLAALKSMSGHLGIKPLDVRPEMGASELYSLERKRKKTMTSIRSGLDAILKEVQSAVSTGQIEQLSSTIGRIQALKAATAV